MEKWPQPPPKKSLISVSGAGWAVFLCMGGALSPEMFRTLRVCCSDVARSSNCAAAMDSHAITTQVSL